MNKSKTLFLPLQESKILDEQVFKSIFRDIDKILPFHQSLLDVFQEKKIGSNVSEKVFLLLFLQKKS